MLCGGDKFGAKAPNAFALRYYSQTNKNPAFQSGVRKTSAKIFKIQYQGFGDIETGITAVTDWSVTTERSIVGLE
jgi:hypothetical protein